MIRSINLKNFMAHADTTIDLHPGLNVIVGENNTGKSAIVLALEILTLLLEETTDDSVEIALAFLKECGAKLTEVTPRGVQG